MVFYTWREAVEAIKAQIGLSTSSQQSLGKQAGTSIPLDMPQIVAAAILRIALAGELDLPPQQPVSERFKNRIQQLHKSSDPAISPQSDQEAEAWVKYLRLLRRMESLTALEINQGDIVLTNTQDFAEVSSISDNGRVFFKGGQGFSSWPDLLSVEAKKDENSPSAINARRNAEKCAALRKKSSLWSLAKSEDLAEFAIKNEISEDDITELEHVIATAKDERPIQQFLEENSHLLTALLGGTERYCLPQKHLGGEYIPDFIIGDTDSLGIRWVLVELETPNSAIYLAKGDQLDAYARKGVNQVVQWREWLSANSSYARKRRADNGLGLFDIREKSDAIVLVGRRPKIPETKDAERYQRRQNDNIHIHSYDWLLENLWGIYSYKGPTGTNPHLFPK